MGRAPKVYMSAPTVDDRDIEAVTEALRSGWIAPVGPEVDAFEADICSLVNVPAAVALSSGTAALEVGMRALGATAGSEILMPTLTFAATAFAAHHVGAHSLFLDVEQAAWGLDPNLLSEVLRKRASRDALPALVVTVDVLGRTADYDAILPICAEYDIPVLVDAAEAVGATHHGAHSGSMGAAGVFSFIGNKIITSSGGGMLVSHDRALVDKARFWSTQAREDAPWYEHREIGTNYRMSNILAALGRSQ